MSLNSTHYTFNAQIWAWYWSSHLTRKRMSVFLKMWKDSFKSVFQHFGKYAYVLPWHVSLPLRQLEKKMFCCFLICWNLFIHSGSSQTLFFSSAPFISASEPFHFQRCDLDWVFIPHQVFICFSFHLYLRRISDGDKKTESCLSAWRFPFISVQMYSRHDFAYWTSLNNHHLSLSHWIHFNY